MVDASRRVELSKTEGRLVLEQLLVLIDTAVALQPETESILRACVADAPKGADLARRGGRLTDRLAEVVGRSAHLPRSPIIDEARGLFRYHHAMATQTLDFAYSIEAALDPGLARYYSDRLGEPAARLQRLGLLVSGYLADRVQVSPFLGQDDLLTPRAAHVLRTPLTTILGHASSLVQPEAHWDRQSEQRFLSRIVEESERLARAIDNILDLAAMQSGALRPDYDWCDSAEVLRAAAASAQKTLAVVVHLEIPAGLPAIWADHRLLARALLNLLDNAVRHNPPGTRVTLAAATTPAGRPLARTAPTARAGVARAVPAEPGSMEDLTVTVTDTGRGLPSEVAEALDRGARLAHLPTAIGTGIGTSMGLVAAHGGTMSYETSARGTCCRIVLPAPPRPAPAPV